VVSAARTVKRLNEDGFIAELHSSANAAAGHGEDEGYEWFRAMATIAGAIVDGTATLRSESECRGAALDDAAELVDDWATNYPADIFTPECKTVDGISGTALRTILPRVAKAIRALGDGGGEAKR
jgi:hypothetical protein